MLCTYFAMAKYILDHERLLPSFSWSNISLCRCLSNSYDLLGFDLFSLESTLSEFVWSSKSILSTFRHSLRGCRNEFSLFISRQRRLVVSTILEIWPRSWSVLWNICSSLNYWEIWLKPAKLVTWWLHITGILLAVPWSSMVSSWLSV